MIPRYANEPIGAIWTDEAKVGRWDQVEIAVVQARMQLGRLKPVVFETIKSCLEKNPVDIKWWLARDQEVGHDLNAYIDERRRHIPVEMQFFFHEEMTSFDTEEAAFVRALHQSNEIVLAGLTELETTLCSLAEKYRYTPMLDRTHGQWAKLCSFGGRLLTYISELCIAHERLVESGKQCRYSRLSGAIGNYGGGLDPELELTALGILGLTPFYGATQIMPRVVYASLAQDLALLAKVIEKIAIDMRLGARSGMPIVQEPFGKKQKGSSAMPHKKNTILTEQMTGMARLAEQYSVALVRGIETWERRAIEQSSVERVAWPDLFHVVMRMLSVMVKVVSGLVVYPDNMLREIIESRGTYASDEAKNFLAEELAKKGVGAEVAYRILQLASFNVFEPDAFWGTIRRDLPGDLQEADVRRLQAGEVGPTKPVSIQELIPRGELSFSDQLEATGEEIQEWNSLLRTIFDLSTCERWDKLFSIPHLLRNEEKLFSELLS